MSRFSLPDLGRSVVNFFRPQAMAAPISPAVPDIKLAETLGLTDEEEELNQPAAFLLDKPSKRDYLDFKPYAESLASLIARKETQTPLTIGVFGAWGSGKTTLMGMIQDLLEEDAQSKGFVCVRFDAWKYYKEDALWRAMLLRVLDVLRQRLTDGSKSDLKDTIQHLEQSLYRDVEWEEKGGLTIDWPQLVKAGAGGALKLSFAFVPGLSALVKAVEAAQQGIGGGKLAEDVSDVAQAFQRDLIVHHQTQLRHIEQFQDQFATLVKKHFAGQRLVIFVDDLDRCLPEKAIEVLEAIKLFLDVKGCVFILGIDHDVITKGLEARYKGIATDGQSLEFSRHYIEKLIQLPFNLPPIEGSAMRSYINSLEVAWPDTDCAQIFAEGLSPNPRQIKRTINVFMLLWSLAEKRLNLETVTALRLAKVVILQTAYPTVFDHLKSDALLLKQLEMLSCHQSAFNNQQLDPVLVEAVNQPSLKNLFQLLAANKSASFASLELDDLKLFFSLARRAPLVSAAVVRAAVTETTTGQEMPVQDRPFQLRSPVPDFVGRSDEINLLLTALRTHASIAVVTGMAGIGKTELALLVSDRLRADYPDGQLFVDMHGSDETSTDAADALSACIRAFAGPTIDLPTKTEELERLYRSHLNNKRALIFLDHAASEAQVTPLIPPKGSVLLITSRNTLVLPGMFNISLDQLSSQEALMLFLSISPTVPTDIASEICRLCGYLPPAVRAAASTLAATPDLKPDDYLKQLSNEQKRIELLGSQGVNVSLEASFSLSYTRLPPDAARVFRKLAVFPDSFDAKAEETICDDPNHSKVSDLLKFGLVLYDAKESRYRVHSLMRLFAQRQLTDDEKEATGKKHALYYLGVVRDADTQFSQSGDALIEGLTLFDRERENINAGFEWSARRAQSDLEAASICSDYSRYSVQILGVLRKSPHAQIEWFKRALESAKRLEDPKTQVPHLIGLGGAQITLGNTDAAIEIYKQALAIASKFHLPQEALIQSNLGLQYRDLGLKYRSETNIERAMECFEQQRALSQQANNSRGVCAALVNLANASLLLGRTDEAVKYYLEAREINQPIGDLRTEAFILGNLGRTYNTIGQPYRALDLCREQLQISQKLGDQLGEAGAHFNIGLALQRIGDLENALMEANEALNIYQQLESPHVKKVQEWLTKWTPKSTPPLDSLEGEGVQS
jgi:tetratricopeptide (TPR) repeat protein